MVIILSLQLLLYCELSIITLMCVYSDEENRIHELSSEVSRLQDAVQKQREEMRTLEHDVTRKAAELEVVSLMCFSLS